MEGLTEPIFLPFMCRLRVLEIYRDIDPSSATMRDFNILSLLIRSLRISLTSPATLEHLKFDIELQATMSIWISMIFLTIYVMPMSGTISTLLSLIQLAHGYKESMLTSSTTLGMGILSWNPTTLNTRNLSLMLCLYFARKAFCLSKPLNTE